MFSQNTDGGGTPRFQLYQNNSAANNQVRTSLTLELKEGDVFYRKNVWRREAYLFYYFIFKNFRVIYRVVVN